MSLWVDKYRPTTLGKLDYHKEQAEYLKNMVNALIVAYINWKRGYKEKGANCDIMFVMRKKHAFLFDYLMMQL